MKEIREIIVLFKTHLDVGYTDMAENVVRNYMENYIPAAMKVAKEMRGEEQRFVWTAGSWLIDRFLQESGRSEEMEEAIRNGDIRWHGLPFTTHTEFMDTELFQYGLSISKKLDERFGMETIAAKMTDVPGHTRAMVPYLVRNGVKFLHLGVNPASSVPAVPPLFRWRAPSGEELVVMYNGDYGEFLEIGDSGTALYFAHTGDNCGPQSAEAIRQIYREIHEKYPSAGLRAGTLEDVAEVALSVPDLPVVTEEIGDSWIHGAGTDPGKVSQYRALLRLRSTLAAGEARKADEKLLLIPEHTWGLCYERYLGDGGFKGEYGYYVRSEFEQMRPTEKFQIMERSWEEQRQYLTEALEAFPESIRERAEAQLAEYKRKETDATGFAVLEPFVLPKQAEGENAAGYAAETNGYEGGMRYEAEINGYKIGVGEDGSLVKLEWGGQSYAEKAHPLGAFLYEVFSPEDFKRFEEQYITVRHIWALEEFGKIGMEKAVDRHIAARPQVTEVLQRHNQLLIKMKMQGEAVELYGAPARLELFATFEEKTVAFDLAWFEKKASRVAEALWLGFDPVQRLTGIHKLGEWIRPEDVVEKGGRRLHGVESGVKFESCSLETVDTALAGVGKPSLLDFNDDAIPVEEGVHFNLFNNIWNTNFPMWYDEDARFRFVLHL